jgi:hypothetical protein
VESGPHKTGQAPQALNRERGVSFGCFEHRPCQEDLVTGAGRRRNPIVLFGFNCQVVFEPTLLSSRKPWNMLHGQIVEEDKAIQGELDNTREL